VNASERLGYPVVVRFDVRADVWRLLRRDARRCIVLCDANPNVTALARDLARGSSHTVPLLAFDLGERAKSPRTLARLWDEFARHDVGRDTLVLGIGGGVAADLFGFASATFARGIRYAHVATSLVAMVDAAIGGKTGVNLREGKNLAGVFADPVGVYAHVAALRTLPLRHVREGLAEVVKASIIAGEPFFRALEELAPRSFAYWPWEEIVARAIGVKAAIVAQDRTEHGARELLNLGHTFGHALERASEYRITHGAGVALGVRAAGLLALRSGIFSQGEQLRLETLLVRLGMPLRTSVTPNAAFLAMQHDKKRRNGRLRFVLPRRIGDVRYGIEAPKGDVMKILRYLNKD
jgi:3-dehydroquinate synthetase